MAATFGLPLRAMISTALRYGGNVSESGVDNQRSIIRFLRSSLDTRRDVRQRFFHLIDEDQAQIA